MKTKTRPGRSVPKLTKEQTTQLQMAATFKEEWALRLKFGLEIKP